MACINMFNPDNHYPPTMSPRISFSNDFIADNAAGPSVRYEQRATRDPSAADPSFEFSVGNYPMMAADELFFKGRLMPLKENYCTTQMQKMTLRDELLAVDGEDEWSPVRKTRRWKELLGLRKANPASVKKHDAKAGDGSPSDKAAVGSDEDPAKASQEVRTQGGAKLRDVEIGI